MEIGIFEIEGDHPPTGVQTLHYRGESFHAESVDPQKLVQTSRVEDRSQISCLLWSQKVMGIIPWTGLRSVYNLNGPIVEEGGDTVP